MSAMSILGPETAASLLSVLLPVVQDVSTNLNLPVPIPLTTNAVIRFVGSEPPGRKSGYLVLSNGWRFWCDEGALSGFESPDTYFGMQSGARLGERFGSVKIQANEAVTRVVARLSKAGIRPEEAFVLPEPVLALPPQFGSNVVPHYRLQWIDPRDGKSRIDVEYDAEKDLIQRLFVSLADWRYAASKTNASTDDLRAPVQVNFTQQSLDWLSDTANRWRSGAGESSIHLTKGDVKVLRWMPSSKELHLVTTQGEQYLWAGSHLVTWAKANAFFVRDHQSPVSSFFGKPRISEADAERLARHALTSLGYSKPTAGLDKQPEIIRPDSRASSLIPHILFRWNRITNQIAYGSAQVEVDIGRGEVTSLTAWDEFLR